MRDSSPKIEVDRAQLLLEARARDADLAGCIEKLIQKLRIHARHLRTVRRRDGFAPRRHGQRGHEDFFGCRVRMRRPMSLVRMGLGGFGRRSRDFRGSNFRGRNFRRCSFRRCNFRRCNFRRCSFRRCNFRRCNFRRCNFRRCNFGHRGLRSEPFGGGDFKRLRLNCRDLGRNDFNQHRIRGGRSRQAQPQVAPPRAPFRTRASAALRSQSCRIQARSLHARQALPAQTQC